MKKGRGSICMTFDGQGGGALRLPLSSIGPKLSQACLQQLRTGSSQFDE